MGLSEIIFNSAGFGTVATILILIFKNNHRVIMTLIKNHSEAMNNFTSSMNEFTERFIEHDEKMKSFIENCKERQ